MRPPHTSTTSCNPPAPTKHLTTGQGQLSSAPISTQIPSPIIVDGVTHSQLQYKQ